MTNRVELVYFEGCPHVERARASVREALLHLDLPAVWTEWDTTLAETPTQYRQFPSPTVLVDSVDVTGGSTSSGPSCAIGGGPGTIHIVDALRAALG